MRDPDYYVRGRGIRDRQPGKRAIPVKHIIVDSRSHPGGSSISRIIQGYVIAVASDIAVIPPLYIIGILSSKHLSAVRLFNNYPRIADNTEIIIRGVANCASADYGIAVGYIYLNILSQVSRIRRNGPKILIYRLFCAQYRRSRNCAYILPSFKVSRDFR